MTERDPRPADGLTPAQAEAVRRLLAGARHDEGIPDEVAARLEATIADLAAELVEGAPADSAETPGTREAVVIPFRRRRWPQVLLAAAAVTVFGFGMAQIVGGGNSADDAGGAGSADKNVAPEVATSQDFVEDPGADGRSQQPAAPPGDSLNGLSDSLLRLEKESLTRLGIKGLRQLRPGTLDQDLAGLTRAVTEGGVPWAYNAARDAADRCGPYYTVTGGETFAASYRRHLALVLFHPELDGVRLVEIYDCESATPRQTVRTVMLTTGE